jgi:cathepsin A (carboxypeptidase C)
MYAAYTENGPYNYKFSNEGFAMDDKFKMEFNKFSWNNKANVLYLD